MGSEADDQLSLIGGFVIFACVPSAGDFSEELGALDEAAKEIELLTAEPIEIITGKSAPDQTPAAFRAWIRTAFATDVDVVFEFHGASFGTGHEDGVAAMLRLPRLMLFKAGDDRSAAAGSDGASRVDEGTFGSLDELRELVIMWLLDGLPRLRAQQLRRELGASRSRASRQHILQLLESRDDDFQHRLADELEMTRPQLLALCCDDRAFSTLTTGDAAYLEWALDPARAYRPEAAPNTDNVPALERLTPRQRRAFEQAKRTWDWDEELGRRVLEHGLKLRDETESLLLAGQPSSFSLESRLGWRTIYRHLCETQS